jgi:hypothetical protein
LLQDLFPLLVKEKGILEFFLVKLDIVHDVLHEEYMLEWKHGPDSTTSCPEPTFEGIVQVQQLTSGLPFLQFLLEDRVVIELHIVPGRVAVKRMDPFFKLEQRVIAVGTLSLSLKPSVHALLVHKTLA